MIARIERVSREALTAVERSGTRIIVEHDITATARLVFLSIWHAVGGEPGRIRCKLGTIADLVTARSQADALGLGRTMPERTRDDTVRHALRRLIAKGVLSRAGGGDRQWWSMSVLCDNQPTDRQRLFNFAANDPTPATLARGTDASDNRLGKAVRTDASENHSECDQVRHAKDVSPIFTRAQVDHIYAVQAAPASDGSPVNGETFQPQGSLARELRHKYIEEKKISNPPISHKTDNHVNPGNPPTSARVPIHASSSLRNRTTCGAGRVAGLEPALPDRSRSKSRRVRSTDRAINGAERIEAGGAVPMNQVLIGESGEIIDGDDYFRETNNPEGSPLSSPMGAGRLKRSVSDKYSTDRGNDCTAGVLPINEVLIEAIDNMAMRSGEMRRRERLDLIERIVEDVRDSAMDGSIPAAAADAVLEGRLAESELWHIAGIVCRKRRAKEISNSPGALFLWLLRQRINHDLKGGAL